MNINDLEIKLNVLGTTGKHGLQKYDSKQIELRDTLIEFINDNKDNKNLTGRLSLYGDDRILNDGFLRVKHEKNDKLGSIQVVHVNGRCFMTTVVFIGTMRRYFADMVGSGEFDKEIMQLILEKEVA